VQFSALYVFNRWMGAIAATCGYGCALSVRQQELSGSTPATYPLRGRADLAGALFMSPRSECYMSYLRILTGTCLIAGAATACHRPMPADDDHMAHMAAGDLATPMPSNPANLQGHAGIPASANTAPARLAASPRHGEWVKLAWEPGSSDSLMAWIVYPSTTRAKTPVVVVVHEIFGLQTWVRSVADQVAADGFIAIAPDLLSRVRGGPSTNELPAADAQKLISGVTAAERVKGITAAASYAMSQPSADQKYGVIGYCWGGQTMWMYATNGGIKGYSGSVAYYGLPYMTGAVPNKDSLAKIKVPMMLLSGANDARIGTAMPAVDSAMTADNKSYFGKNYGGANHGFLRLQDDPKTPPNADGQAADLAATTDAWPRTIAFLKKNLGMN
jgi:carboxymethylenebutenolidase